MKPLKPKPSQTMYVVQGTGSVATMKPLFIEETIVTPLTDTVVGLETVDIGLDENNIQVFSQQIRVELLDHIVVSTRCGEMFDLTTNQRTCEFSGREPFSGRFFSSKKKAKRFFEDRKKLIFIIDEGTIYHPPRVETIGREAIPEEMAAVVALANRGQAEVTVEDWTSNEH